MSIDGSYVSVHQHASGARRGESRAVGKSRGGSTTKIHMASDAHGNPLCFKITESEVHDSQVAGDLIDEFHSEYLIADKAYDSDEIRDKARSKKIKPVIPRRKNSKKKNKDFDRHIYKSRHQIENLFARLKHFRGIATRFEKLARNFKAMLSIACMFIWLKLQSKGPVK